MLIKFHSSATGSLAMFHEPAVQLIRMMGASGQIPSAFSAKEVPGALEKLRAGLQHVAPARPASRKESMEYKEQPIDLPLRAQPLVELLERAIAENAEVMWDKQA